MKRLIPIFIVTLSLYYFLIDKDNTPDILSNLAEKKLVAADKTKILPAEAERTDLTHRAATELAKTNSSLSFEEALEMLEWQSNNGYPSLNDNGSPIKTDYDSYSLETLKSLVQNGDRIASQKIGQISFQSGEFADAEKYFWDASIRGFTYTISELANIYIAKSNNETNLKLKREYLIDAYSFYEVALKRGDLMAKFPMKMYNNNFNIDEQNKITLLANKRYNQLVDDRKSLSLSEFDNSSPVGLSKILKGQLSVD